MCTGSGQGLIGMMLMIVNELRGGTKDLPVVQIRALPVLTSGWLRADLFVVLLLVKLLIVERKYITLVFTLVINRYLTLYAGICITATSKCLF